MNIIYPYIFSNMLNHYFVNVVKDNTSNFSCDKSVCRHWNGEQYVRADFSFKFVDPVEVKKVIYSMKNNDSSGLDKIPLTVIKGAKQHLRKVLNHLVNSSFVSGYFPNKLKKSKIIPVYKKNDVKTISNYRLISLLPVGSKMYEKNC